MCKTCDHLNDLPVKVHKIQKHNNEVLEILYGIYNELNIFIKLGVIGFVGILISYIFDI